MAEMAPPDQTPNKKNVKVVELKWISRANRPKSPKRSPRRYNLRNKKNQPSSPKKTATNSNQKKIQNFFPISPKPKINNNDLMLKTPVKKVVEASADDLDLSPSTRFDSLMPKVEDILRAREDEEKFKKIQAIIAESSKRFLEGLNNSTSEPQPMENTPSTVTFNNCKHLSMTHLTRRFKKDIKYIDDIFYGRVPNERYELFKKDTPLNNGTKNDLRVNDVNIAFTQDQLIHIVSLFRGRYDNGNIYKYSDLYFKVLLPEYCLKIYSDVYKMTPKDALDYLKSVPVHVFN